jgi:hypothetical protein
VELKYRERDKTLSRVDERDMRVRRIVPTILATLLLIGGLCHGQSLGEAARQIRQQKQKDGTAAKKVIDTDDLSYQAALRPDCRSITCNSDHKRCDAGDIRDTP